MTKLRASSAAKHPRLGETLGHRLGTRLGLWLRQKVHTPKYEAPRRLSLALQGGGSFGAFTWGVLDRLLQDDRIQLDTISGASAGAINAALLSCGLVDGKREDARQRLESFWKRVSAVAPFVSLAKIALQNQPGFGHWLRDLAPVQSNPFDLNPLRAMLSDEIDFDALRRSPVRLMVSATRVRDGRLRIFQNAELDVERLLASACLPMIHKTIMIDGEGYWDGGYVANPPLLHLVRATRTPDIMIVRLTPSHIKTLPTRPRDVARRLDEITFNAPLEGELDALEGLIWRSRHEWHEETPSLQRLRALQLHTIAAQDTVAGLNEASASDITWGFLSKLRDAGRAATQEWLDQDWQKVHQQHTP